MVYTEFREEDTNVISEDKDERIVNLYKVAGLLGTYNCPNREHKGRILFIVGRMLLTKAYGIPTYDV